MSHDEFTKLFKYIEQFRTEMHTEFAQVHARFNSLEGLVDAHEKRIETLEQERVFANHQLNLHEEWITKAAAKTKVKYKR